MPSEIPAQDPALLARLTAALERLLASPPAEVDWHGAPAYVWDGAARPVGRLAAPGLDQLRGIDEQKALVTEKVARLAQGACAHDMLLWGARGMGKSALLRAAVIAVQAADPTALALVQVAPAALATVPALFSALADIPRQFLIFFDDIGFAEGDSVGPRSLRSWLEGGIEARPANLRLAVTSNRRAIVARHAGEQDDPLNPRDARDDALALADRFGLVVGFHNCSQGDYLAIIAGYAQPLGLDWEPGEAIAWAAQRGARSGRVAWQFVVELAGRAGKAMS